MDVVPVHKSLCVFLIQVILWSVWSFLSTLVTKGISLQKSPQEVKDLKLFFQKYDLNRNGRPLRQTTKDEVDGVGL